MVSRDKSKSLVVIRNMNEDNYEFSEGGSGYTGSPSSSAVTKTIARVKEPSLFKVVLHNDDFTPMEFVVRVLMLVFHKEKEAATQIMMDVHEKGNGVCGIFPFDVAETKVAIVIRLAQSEQYPLKCTMEKA